MSESNGDPALDKFNCEVRTDDPRKVKKVTYEGKRYLDVTDYYTEAFFNGMQYEGMLSRKKILKGGKQK